MRIRINKCICFLFGHKLKRIPERLKIDYIIDEYYVCERCPEMFVSIEGIKEAKQYGVLKCHK